MLQSLVATEGQDEKVLRKIEEHLGEPVLGEKLIQIDTRVGNERPASLLKNLALPMPVY